MAEIAGSKKSLFPKERKKNFWQNFFYYRNFFFALVTFLIPKKVSWKENSFCKYTNSGGLFSEKNNNLSKELRKLN